MVGDIVPVDEEEWQAGRLRKTNPEYEVLTFLMNNPNTGFTIKEIMTELGYDTDLDVNRLGEHEFNYRRYKDALEKLVTEGSIEAKLIKTPIEEETYYRAEEPKKH